MTLGLTTLAAFVLALGLGVTGRAMRTSAELAKMRGRRARASPCSSCAVRMSAELAEMRAEFMSSVTHELKTPIASIQAMAETLSRGRLRDPRAQQEYAALVVQEAKRLERLVNNMLAYSRLTDVANVYFFEPMDIDDVMEACLMRFNRQLHQEHYAIAVDIPADVPSIVADRAAMELLFDNLINNSIRYSGATKDIRVAVESRDGNVCVEISDRGVGIAPEDLDRVTRKFVRGRNATAGGSGLGLAIVERIVNDHHGSFTIESSLGRGTTVRVVLLAASEERVDARQTPMSRVSL